MNTTMKKHFSPRRTFRLYITLLMLGCLLFSAVLPVCAANDYPKAQDKVADDAGVLSESTIRTIKKLNESLAADVGASIAVCTVKTTGDTEIRDYARELFKEWKLGEGVLLLIAAEDENYYLMQSVGVDKIITNEVLEGVRDNYLEEDFAAGNIDRGVFKSVNNLSTLLVSSLEDAAETTDDANSETSGEEAKEEEKGTTFGSVIVGFFKVILWIALIAAALFLILFVAALFNDDAAEIFQFVWQTVILRKNKTYSMPNDYYDERLYGNRNGSRQPQNGQRRPQSGQRPAQLRNPQQNYAGQLPAGNPRSNPNNNPYGSQYGSHSGSQNANQNASPYGSRNPQYPQNRPVNQNQRQPQYYNADGTPRQQRSNPNAQYRQPQNPGYPQQNAQAQQNSQYFGDETRAFTIPDRGNSGNRR